MAKSKAKGGAGPGGQRIYELEVSILSGPMTEDFIDDNPSIRRTLQIRGDQTLRQLHEAIFKAFDRFDEHLYEFQIGGKGPMDPKARRYGLGMAEAVDPGQAGDVMKTRLDDLRLKVGEIFGYWFDFGDDWWHQIEVREIGADEAGRRYPRVTGRTGASPPQYPEEED